MSKSEKRKFYNFFEQAYCEKALGEFEKIDLEGRIERIIKDYMESITPGMKHLTKKRVVRMESDSMLTSNNLKESIKHIQVTRDLFRRFNKSFPRKTQRAGSTMTILTVQESPAKMLSPCANSSTTSMRPSGWFDLELSPVFGDEKCSCVTENWKERCTPGIKRLKMKIQTQSVFRKVLAKNQKLPTPVSETTVGKTFFAEQIQDYRLGKIPFNMHVALMKDNKRVLESILGGFTKGIGL